MFASRTVFSRKSNYETLVGGSLAKLMEMHQWEWGQLRTPDVAVGTKDGITLSRKTSWRAEVVESETTAGRVKPTQTSEQQREARQSHLGGAPRWIAQREFIPTGPKITSGLEKSPRATGCPSRTVMGSGYGENIPVGASPYKPTPRTVSWALGPYSDNIPSPGLTPLASPCCHLAQAAKVGREHAPRALSKLFCSEAVPPIASRPCQI